MFPIIIMAAWLQLFMEYHGEDWVTFFRLGGGGYCYLSHKAG